MLRAHIKHVLIHRCGQKRFGRLQPSLDFLQVNVISDRCPLRVLGYRQFGLGRGSEAEGCEDQPCTANTLFHRIWLLRLRRVTKNWPDAALIRAPACQTRWKWQATNSAANSAVNWGKVNSGDPDPTRVIWNENRAGLPHSWRDYRQHTVTAARWRAESPRLRFPVLPPVKPAPDAQLVIATDGLADKSGDHGNAGQTLVSHEPIMHKAATVSCGLSNPLEWIAPWL